MDWFELEIRVPEKWKDAVSNQLFELGAQGVWECGAEAPDLLKGYFESTSKSDVEKKLPLFLKSLSEIDTTLPMLSFKLVPVAEVNWAEKYKEHYFAQPMTKTFFLLPAWDKTTQVPDGMVPIRMEPGQAFGTGLHPSTQLSMGILERVIHELAKPENTSCLDVGTGSGILAIAAAKLGIGTIQGIDNDSTAVETAKENLVLNSAEKVELKTGELSSIKGTFELVVSNILLETHLQLLTQYRTHLKPNGVLILAGLLVSQKNEIVSALTAEGFLIESEENMQEWLALSCIFRG